MLAFEFVIACVLEGNLTAVMLGKVVAVNLEVTW